MADRLFDKWMSKHVRVTSGPFKDKEGQVAGVGAGRCEVAFPESTLQKDHLWFSVSQLEQVKP